MKKLGKAGSRGQTTSIEIGERKKAENVCEEERKEWVGVWKHDGRGQRKRCQTVAQGDMRAEMRKIQLKHCFPGLERPKQLNTEDRLRLQRLCQGCMCCDGGCGGFRHLAELRLNEQSSYNTREVQTAETLAITWKDQPFLHIKE